MFFFVNKGFVGKQFAYFLWVVLFSHCEMAKWAKMRFSHRDFLTAFSEFAVPRLESRLPGTDNCNSIDMNHLTVIWTNEHTSQMLHATRGYIVKNHE